MTYLAKFCDICWSKWFTPRLKYPSCLPRLFCPSSLSLVLPTPPSYQCPSTVACLTSCGKCSYGGCCCSVISIQMAELDPLLGFAQSSSFDLSATPAYQLPPSPKINLSLWLSIRHSFCKFLIYKRPKEKYWFWIWFDNSKEYQGLVFSIVLATGRCCIALISPGHLSISGLPSPASPPESAASRIKAISEKSIFT